MDEVIYFYFGQHESEKDIDDTFIELLKKADIFVFESGKTRDTNVEQCFGPLAIEDVPCDNNFQFILCELLDKSQIKKAYLENAPNQKEIIDSVRQSNKLRSMILCGEPKEKIVPFFKTFMDYSMKTVFKKRDDYFLKQLQNLAKEHPDKKIVVHRGIAHLPFFQSRDDKTIGITVSTAPETFSEDNKFDIEHYKRVLGQVHKTYGDDEHYQFAKNRFNP